MNVTVPFGNNNFDFLWIDYGLFILMLLLSVLIGFYYGCCGQQNTATEYLLGNRQMSAIPIGISLVASNISGITLLGVPTDIYRFGVTYYLYALVLIPVCLATYHIFIPVFHNLQVVSAYEYFMIRFDRRARLLASGLFVLNNMLYLPIVVYIPALALAQATRISIHYITPVICSVCILYTTIGGLKTVVWTDTLQFVAMIGSITGVTYYGIESIGGVNALWRAARGSKHLDLDFDVDPTKRDTVLATVIGTFTMGFSTCCFNQSFVQKYLSMPTMSDIKRALWLFYIGMILILTLVTGIGLTMSAKYSQCDPLAAGYIQKHDQILPFYVMQVATVIPGLAGLFLSGIMSAALSTLSAFMNSLAASIYEDFIAPFVPTNLAQKKISNILKFIVVLIGLISTLLVYVVEHLGAIVPINFALSSITNGPILGLFLLGMLFPIANAQGALFGATISLAITTFIVGGAEYHKYKGHVPYDAKLASITGCNLTSSILSNNNSVNPSDADIFAIFKITHYYYTPLGVLITIFVGLVISYLTQKTADAEVNPHAISPLIHWVTSAREMSRTEAAEQDTSGNSVKEAEGLLTQLRDDTATSTIKVITK